MDMKLALVPVPVSDVDRAKFFYTEQLGFHLEHDVIPTEGMRVVQMTPPGSACSIVIGTGMGEISEMTPGSLKSLHLVVDDVSAVRALLIERGVAIEEIDDMGGILYAGFSDPDGNTWLLQEIPARFR